MQGKSLLILGAVIVVALFVFLGYWTISPSSAPPPSKLPAHVVNDVWKEGNTVWLFLIVKSALDQESARKLINYYTEQYPSAAVLNIDMFCDGQYASHASVQSKSSDSEYYSHVLYSYINGPAGVELHTSSNPLDPKQASACNSGGAAN